MTITIETTPNQGYDKPVSTNSLSADVARMRNTIDKIDNDMAAALLAIALRSPLANPVFTGTVQVPTPTAGDNTNKAASTAFVAQAIENLIGGAPAALNTLNEIAAALDSNPAAITDVLDAVALKVGYADFDAVLAGKVGASAGVVSVIAIDGDGAVVQIGRIANSIGDYGATGDGVADDLVALTSAAAEGAPVLLGPGTYRLSSNYDPVSPVVAFGGAIEIDGDPLWYPTTFWDWGNGYLYGKRTVKLGTYSGTPTSYEHITQAHQIYLEWFNQEGYQQPDGMGKYSSDSGGRTGMTQMRLKGSHNGWGDGYNIVYSMAVYGHADPANITAWSGQASGGFAGGGTGANSDKCNLYGIGDIILDDYSREDISMLGHVIILRASGTDSGDYRVPRFAYYARQDGIKEVDFVLSGSGLFKTGLDTTGYTLSGNAVSLKSGQKIGFNATGFDAGDGKYFSDNSGNTYIRFDGTRLVITSNGVDFLKLDESNAIFGKGADTGDIVRIYGTSATSLLNLGQSGDTSVITAASTGAGNTSLLFKTALAGAETSALSISPNGRLNLIATPTYADNAAAVTAGLAIKDVYITATGEVRVRV